MLACSAFVAVTSLTARRLATTRALLPSREISAGSPVDHASVICTTSGRCRSRRTTALTLAGVPDARLAGAGSPTSTV